MKAQAGFEKAMERAEHLITLYDLLRDTRQRSIRSDWASKFNALMHWPQGENIIRVDGKDKNSILILRESVGITRQQFAHYYLSELLRAALVTAVSALDRFMHDLVVEKSWALLRKGESEVPNEMRKIRISVVETKRALERLRADAKARPGHIVKKAIQDVLHRDYTFQKPDDILKAGRMLGIEDFWGRVAEAMPGNPNKDQIIQRIRTISKRRNQIVHEADLIVKTKPKKVRVREIKRSEVVADIEWLRTFVRAVAGLVQ